jgi:hypothetical protein
MVPLVASRRHEAKTIALDLSQAQLLEANAEAERASAALRAEQAAGVAKDELIAKLQTMIVRPST